VVYRIGCTVLYLYRGRILVILTSPYGGESPVDLLSMTVPFTTQYTEKFLKDPLALFEAKHTRK
jgi:hypothetical protein